MVKPTLLQHVFIITHDENNLTAVEEAVVMDVEDHQYVCIIVEPKLMNKHEMRYAHQLYDTQESAQKELDGLNSYIAYRMSSHKK